MIYTATLPTNITKAETYKQKDDIKQKQHPNNKFSKRKLNTIFQRHKISINTLF